MAIGIGSVILWMGLAISTASCGGWQSAAPVCMAGAQFDDGGQCRAQPAEDHHIPFRKGYEARVTQGFHGFDTHREDMAYAVDFACDEGTPVTASRSGVVWSVRDDSSKNCPDPECVDDANYVILDHGDGTYSAYFHLQFKGVTVEPGQQVCRGQLLGLCGDTGFASGPHLHFSVLNAHWSTVPVLFRELRENSPPVALPRNSYESENERTIGCGHTEYSTLGAGAFAHRGILLREPLSLVIESAEDRTMYVDGVYSGQDTHVAIHRRRTDENGWIEQCVAVDDDGEFRFRVDWPAQIFDEGYYFLMLTGSDEDCRAPGWAWAYRVHVRSSH